MKTIYQNKKSITGILHYDIVKNGKVLSTENYNLTVNNSSRVLARLVGMQGTYSNSAITQIGFGTANAAASSTATNLGGTVYRKAISSVTYSSGAPYDVQFNFTLEEDEFNGNDIWQFGLFTGDNVLFSMLSRNPSKGNAIEKDDEVVIVGYWKLEFRNV